MTEAVSMLCFCKSTLLAPLLIGFSTEGENRFALPALSDLPSESKYAGLNFPSLPVELLMHNNAFGSVSCILPIEVYLQNKAKSVSLNIKEKL